MTFCDKKAYIENSRHTTVSAKYNVKKELQMYFENNRRAAESRADADFLRRMLGGELNGNGCGCERAGERANERSCNRAPIQPRRDTGACCEWRPQQQARQEAPVRPEGGCGCQKPCDTSCPTEIAAPALAMVYSPRQCWRKLLDPEEGLKQGTIFSELVLPFEAVPHKGGKEGCARRPM